MFNPEVTQFSWFWEVGTLCSDEISRCKLAESLMLSAHKLGTSAWGRSVSTSLLFLGLQIQVPLWLRDLSCWSNYHWAMDLPGQNSNFYNLTCITTHWGSFQTNCCWILAADPGFPVLKCQLRRWAFCEWLTCIAFIAFLLNAFVYTKLRNRCDSRCEWKCWLNT